MASKRRNMFQKNKTQETTENVSGKCQPLFPGGVRNKCSHNNYQVCCETSHDPSKQTSGCSRSADYQSTSWCMPSWDYEIPPKECTPALCQPFRSQNVIADCYYNNYPVLCQNMMHPGTRAYLRCSNQLDIQPVETVCLPTGEWRQPLPE
ncbi:hypothetical protein AAG570_003130 [Ranatra chinensis]|uniref:Uncharacterized protein n=1 Tax=Ranatra chinensis TaxID=642074 RepID=A0ABD0YUC7_9HEMI